VSADPPKPRAVFDCMVFLQGAARRDGAAGACLLLVERKAVELFLSGEVLSEIRDVLNRPKVRHKFPALNDQRVEQFLQALEKMAEIIHEVPRAVAYERDPRDEPYVNLAIAARAGFLVSRDGDFLDLANPSNADGALLRNLAPGLQILDPVSFLREVRRHSQTSP